MKNLNIEPDDPELDPRIHDPELWAQLQELCTPRFCDSKEMERIETEGADIIRKLVDNRILREMLNKGNKKHI